MAVKVRERKPGEWWIFVDHRGKRYAKKIGRNKEKAETVAAGVEEKLKLQDLGLLPPEKPKTVTLEKFSERYLGNVEHTVKHTTWVDYESNLRLHILPTLGKLTLDQITKRHIKDLALKLRRDGKKPKGVRKVVGTLSACLAEAVDDGEIGANPAVQLRNVYRSPDFHDSDKQKDVNPLTRRELAHLLATALNHSEGSKKGRRPGEPVRKASEIVFPFRDHHPFVLLLARTGLRLGEAIGLQWGDVDLHGGFLEVRRAIVRGRVTAPKNKKTRRVYLSAQLQDTLRTMRQERFEKVVALDPATQAARKAEADVAASYVFPGATAGRWMDGDNFRARVFEPLLQAAELRHIRIHDLRHTYASQMIEAGKELHFIQEQLGHHSPKFTLEVYGHLLPRDRRTEVNCLDDGATIRNPAATSSQKTVAA